MFSARGKTGESGTSHVLRIRWAVQVLGALALVGVLTAVPSAAGEWQGREAVQDGVRHILNPATPRDGQREIVLRELWRLGEGGGDEGTVDGEGGSEFFGVIGSIFLDPGGNFYILDTQLSELRVYAPDGSFLRSIGRAGEGPGEFTNSMDASRLADGRLAVSQIFPGKLVLFHPDGTSAGTLPLKLGEAAAQSFMVLMETRMVGDRLGINCVDQTFAESRMTQNYVLGLFDLQGALQRRVLDFRVEMDLREGYAFIESETARFTRRWDAGPDGTIYTPVDFHGYAIHVFDPAGDLKMIVEREYPSIARTPDEKARVEEIFAGYVRTAPNARVVVEDTHNDIEQIVARPDGTIWALTSQGRYRAPAGVLGIYDVFDSEGRFAEQITLRGPGDPREDAVYVLGDRVVVVGNLMSAVVAAAGAGGTGSGGAEEATSGSAAAVDEAVVITCYAF